MRWLTKSFEKLRSRKFSIKKHCIIDGVVGPAHTDEEDIHAACWHEQRGIQDKVVACIYSTII